MSQKKSQLASKIEWSEVEKDLHSRLLRVQKSLPAYYLYDEQGSKLYEEITSLPEYYPTRTEKAILRENSADIVLALKSTGLPSNAPIYELGSGSAEKSVLILRELLQSYGHAQFIACDVSEEAIRSAADRISQECPKVQFGSILGDHQKAFENFRKMTSPIVVMFIGSSIGNYDDDEALQLLSDLRQNLPQGSVLILGTDMLKSPAVLLPAYDDAQGTTASFNLNLLTRLNREYQANFDLSAFAHLAKFNPRYFRIEMHLRSLKQQSVQIPCLDLCLNFHEGETIHTESSVKYDEGRLQDLLLQAGFQLQQSFYDEKSYFGVHLAGLAEEI